MPLFALSAAIAVLALFAAAWAWLRPKPPLEVSRVNITLPDSQALVGSQTNTSRVALSRDGRMIAYMGEEPRTRGRWQLYLRRLDRLTVERIAGTENGINPAFSPDGKRLAFVGGSPRALKVISLAGGPPQVLTDSLVDLGGVSWSPDGYIYYDGHFEGDGLARIRETGGKPEIASRPNAESESWHSMPWALPNGRGVLFAIARARGASPFDIAVLDTRTGTHRVLVRGVAPRYAESGHLLYVAEDGALMATRFDPDRLTTIGEPTAMTAGVSVMGLGRADVEISQKGTLLYAAGAPQTRDRELVWVTRAGQVSAVDSGWRKQIRTLPALSPDGRSVAVGLQVGAAGFEAWVKQLDRGPASKIADLGVTPVWSPNGRDIAYWGTGGIHGGPADGSVLPRLRYPRSVRSQSFEYSPDGQWIVGSTMGDIVAFRIGDTTRVPLVATPALERRPTISPDGRWLAYESDDGGTLQIYVRPFPAVETAKRQVSVDGGMLPRWSRDGRELFFLTPSFDVIAAPVSLSPTFSAGIPRVLFNASFNFPPLPFDVDIDGKRFLMTRPVGGAREAPDELVVVENFVEELRARLPR